MPIRPTTCLVVVAALAASTADATIAVTVTTPDQNVQHREIASGLVEALQTERALLLPPLATDDVALCRGDQPCLHRLGAAKGASHLLMIGVAGVDVRGALITFTVLGPDGGVLLDDSAMLRGSADPRRDGASLTPRILAIPGLDPPSVVVERGPQPAARPYAIPGAALVGAGAIVAGASVLGAFAVADTPNRDVALPLALGGGIIGVAGAAVGAAFVVGDAL